MGAWADIFGRKTILYIWCISAVLGQIGIMLTAIFMEWPKEIYLVAELPKAILGNKLKIQHKISRFIKIFGVLF